MKFNIYKSGILPVFSVIIMICMLMPGGTLRAQDDTTAKEEAPVVKKAKPVKNTFQSIWIIDNQTVMVPIKKTFEMDIMHRFGTVNKGYEDFWGFFAPSNIRLGFSYVPIDKLNIGIGVTKTTAAVIPNQGVSTIAGPMWDASLKYSIITQTKNKYPVSVSYYANAAYNTKKDENKDIFRNYSDRLSYFHQLLIARKVTDRLSVQVAPSLSHHNLVNGYYVKLNDSTLKIKPDMSFDHFAIAFSARYKITEVTAIMVNYDQPITKHAQNNPNPNLSFGIEFNTSSHAFQIFFTNYFFMVPQTNNLYNRNSPFDYSQKYYTKDATTGDPVLNERNYQGGKFLIGFNITRLWNY
jgi:Membrane bound beta barrel domain (DUF5777)